VQSHVEDVGLHAVPEEDLQHRQLDRLRNRLEVLADDAVGQEAVLQRVVDRLLDLLLRELCRGEEGGRGGGQGGERRGG
jgi:hypothetical protein